MTTTGYGEELVKNAFRCDYGLVETVAHFTAAKYFMPDVDFIIDIGGQDMKCFKIEDGAISNIFLNEACSSGCGSFLQTFAQALGYDVKEFAALGLFADRPVDLGSRCTVFMNSSVKQAQKDGASIENISAGLSISVVKNALYKVIRASSPEELGRKIVVQGGTFYNEAVLRAFEKEMGVEVIRPDIAGLMGAYGAALYGLRQSSKAHRTASGMMSQQELEAFEQKVVSVKCGGCGNHCQLTVNTFADGRKYISGNRCDKPVTGKSADNSLNLYAYKQELLASYKPVPGKRGSIGIPLCLGFYELLPFWWAFWTKLGFAVHTSPVSSRGLYLAGQATIPSDTACFPAKLSHGHIKALSQMELDAIFYPCLTYNVDEGLGDNHYNCPVVAYYPEVLAGNCPELEGKKFIYDYVGIHRPKDFVHKMAKTVLPKYFGGISEKEVQEPPTPLTPSTSPYGQNPREGQRDHRRGTPSGQAHHRAGGPPLPCGPGGQPRHRPSDHPPRGCRRHRGQHLQPGAEVPYQCAEPVDLPQPPVCRRQVLHHPEGYGSGAAGVLRLRRGCHYYRRDPRDPAGRR